MKPPRLYSYRHAFHDNAPAAIWFATGFGGVAYDESTLLDLADACQRAVNLKDRPPLEKFLVEKDQFLKGEKLPD